MAVGTSVSFTAVKQHDLTGSNMHVTTWVNASNLDALCWLGIVFFMSSKQEIQILMIMMILSQWSLTMATQAESPSPTSDCCHQTTRFTVREDAQTHITFSLVVPFACVLKQHFDSESLRGCYLYLLHVCASSKAPIVTGFLPNSICFLRVYLH